MSSRRYPTLEEYGLVGDGRSAALVSRDGSVDWWCPPRFDAPSVFARLLDDRIGGFCSLAPAGAVHASPMWESSQRYRPGTNVLVTRFRGADAALRVTDFMPRGGPAAADGTGGPPTLIRRAEARGGPVQAELRFAPRFDYARRTPEYREARAGWVASGGDGELLALSADPALGLDADGRRAEIAGRFRVEPGDPRWFVLRRGSPRPSPPSPGSLRGSLEETAERWRRRAEEVRFPGEETGGEGVRPFAGRARERVVRSALALDLLTHAPTGDVVEAATTSLPGAGPGRDGRLPVRSRDGATAVLTALEGLGRRREARRFCRRLAEAGRESRLRGDVPGAPDSGEDGDAGDGGEGGDSGEGDGISAGAVLEHLHGYRGHRPVGIHGPGGDGFSGRGAARGAEADHRREAPGQRDANRPRPLARDFEEARALAVDGRTREAAEVFEEAASAAGPTGLLAEARDPESGRLAGNLPSAVAHASLVDAARVIARALRRTSTATPGSDRTSGPSPPAR